MLSKGFSPWRPALVFCFGLLHGLGFASVLADFGLGASHGGLDEVVVSEAVATRNVDTVYTGREGPLLIEWPDREIGARIEPSPDLGFTTLYVPEREDYFCVEPVSHMTDAFNRHTSVTGARVLAAGEEWSVAMRLEVYAL